MTGDVAAIGDRDGAAADDPPPRAYVIARIDVQDEARYARYVAAATPVIARFGGRVLARGGPARVLEGTGRTRNVVIEFASLADAERYYRSDDYQAARALREGAAVADFVAVTGVEPRRD